MSEEDDKWSCNICTFANFSSSVKCTMCRSKRCSVAEDIYRLQNDFEENVGKQSAARAVTPEPPSWSCNVCTFSNFEKSVRCVQCDEPRRNVRSPKNTNVIMENSLINLKNDRFSYAGNDEFDTKFRKISKSNSQNLGSQSERATIIKSNSQNILESAIYASQKKLLERKSPEKGCGVSHSNDRLIKNSNDVIDSNKLSESLEKGSPCSHRSLRNQHNLSKPSDERDNINEIAKAKSNYFAPPQVSKDDSSGCSTKWPCSFCTYENWPKAVKCVMCGLGLNPSPERFSPPILDSPDCDNARGLPQPINEDNNASNLRRSNSKRFDGTGAAHVPPRKQLSPNNCDMERRLRLSRQADWSWLEACIGVVEGDPQPVEAYLSSGGDPARYLTAPEVAVLNRPSAFDVGHTLVHLAIRFHREDMLAVLLSQIEGDGAGVKRVPSYVAPDLAADIRRHVSSTLRQRKGGFPCYFVTEITTFALPAEVEDLSTLIQNQLFEELLDKEVQSQLESDPPVLNWSLELTVRLGSRLYALWNRSAGDCLLDSVMQATWGVFDRENVLRRALAESLEQGSHLFYPRWKEYESSQATLLHFSLDETQYEDDWAGLVSLANQPGSSLDQLHVFALSHILRRPIIVYGVKFVKSFRGENLGLARFEGVYLPLLWEPSFCIRSPLALGYTRGHFSALVPLEPYTTLDMCTKMNSPDNVDNNDHLQITFLPLMDRDRKILPVHFLSQDEVGKEESVLRQWLDVCVTEGGIMVAQQQLHKRPLLVAQMLEEWLNHYRRIDQMSQAPYNSRAGPAPDAEYSSEGDSEDE